MIAAGVLTAALAASGLALWNATRPVDHPLVRWDVDLGPDARLGRSPGVSAKLSPDGTRLVFLSEAAEGRLRLSTRRLAESTATPLSGTEGAHDFFFSPDSNWVAFFSPGKLSKVFLNGGSPVPLCAAAQGRGGSWGQDGFIIASLDLIGGLVRVPASGGEPKPVTTLDPKTGEDTHRWPQVLPGGNAILFTAGLGGSFDYNGSVDVFSPKTGQRKTLVRGSYHGRYLPSGHLAYISGNSLHAAPMDVQTLELTGLAVPVLGEVSSSSFYGRAVWDTALNGTLLYQQGKESLDSVSGHWLNQSGKLEPLLPNAGIFTEPRFSPDGNHLAVASTEGGNVDIWVHSFQKNSMTRLTFQPEAESAPVWTPDGRHIFFADQGGISWIPSGGSGASQRFLKGKDRLSPATFSPDGRILVCMQVGSRTSFDIWMVPIQWNTAGIPVAGKPEPFQATKFIDVQPRFSPDGRWIAYASAESGFVEVYVRPAPGSSSKNTGGKWQVSKGNGRMPVWSRNGHELFYRNDDYRLMVLDYDVKGDSFVAGAPRLWSNQRIFNPTSYSNFDIAPDGKRFAVLLTPDVVSGDKPRTQITVLQNFFDDVRLKIKQSGPQ